MGPVQGAGMATLPEATRGAVHERTFFELSWSHVTWVSSTGGSLVGIGEACSHRLAAPRLSLTPIARGLQRPHDRR